MTEGNDPLASRVAVIGMSGRFPGAPDLEAFWSNLCNGVTSIERFSDEQLLQSGVDPASLADPHYVPAAGVIEAADEFDAEWFGYSPREAELIDPQQRWFLQCSWEALEAAGYDPARYPGLVGVFGGATTSTYQFHLYGHPDLAGPTHGLAIALGNDPSFLTSRVSHKLDLRGPCCAVQTACSTGLVAIHLACQSLLNAECDMAIAGAASIRVPLRRGYHYQPGGILSPDGVCRPFDARSQGTLFSSGVGVVVLKRLQDAIDDGDWIHAVIRGSAVNNDGAVKASFTAPSVAGQQEVICSALVAADVDPRSIALLEAHGTGTAIGDSIEIQALRDAFAERGCEQPHCSLGSVKANLGHLDAAAGIASFIKTVLAIREQKLPPTPNVEQPHPNLRLESTPFRVQTRLQSWPADAFPRRAGVSAFGFGGTNAHVILEQAPPAAASTPTDQPQCLTISAQQLDGITKLTARLASRLASDPNLALADVAYTLQMGRRACRFRRAIICRDSADALHQLESLSARSRIDGQVEPQAFEVVFVLPHELPSQNTPLPSLLVKQPVFRQAIEQCGRAGTNFSADVLLDTRRGWKDLSPLGRFALQWGLARTWLHWGVRPAALMAHGIGEYVAACLAGFWTCEQAMRLLSTALAGAGPRSSAVSQDFASALSALSSGRSSLPWYSTAAADWHSDRLRPGEDAGRWYRSFQGAGAVEQAAEQFTARARSSFVELGGNSQLALSLREKLTPAATQRVVSSCSPSDPEPLLSAVARLWVQGATIDWPKLHEGERRRRVPLPTTPLAAHRHWLDKWEEHGRAESRGVTDSATNSATRRVADVGRWLYLPSWRQSARIASTSIDQANHARQWILFGFQAGVVGRWGEALARQLANLGHRVTILLPAPPGSPPERLGDGRWRIDPLSREQLAHCLRDATPDVVPLNLVYLWSLGCNDGTARELPADRETAALTLLQLAGVLADASAGQASLRIVVSDLYDVTGDERLETSAAALAGLSRVIPQEYPHIDCTVIDLDRHTIEDSLVAGQESMPRIVSELGFAAARESVAYRHGRRWTCGYEPCLLPPVERLPRRLRRGGVYWITGGLGEIGQAMARYLARRAEARLLLTTRTAMPPQDAWDRIVSQSAPGDVTARRINLVRQLRAQGTELIVAAADVCDESQMRSALALAEGRWGQVQGVIHAAGLIRGDAFQPLRDTGRSIVRRHLEAKVVGLEVLDRLLENRALDFCLLVSSLSSILGGLRYGAYAAANACLDAHAWQRQRASRTKWISVNWDSWLRADVEDALPKSADPSGLVMRAAEGIDVLARILDHDLGPQVVVSTGNLLARLDRWVKRETTDPPALSAPSQPAHRRTLHPRPDLRSEYRAPRTELEQRLVELWKELLGLAEVGTLDSFFELGGDSLLGLQVIERIGQDTGQQISPIAIYESPTIQQLAASLAGDGSAEQPSVAGQDRGERRRQLQDQRAGRHPGRSSEG